MEPNERDRPDHASPAEGPSAPPTAWHKVLEPDPLDERRVAPVACGHRHPCMTRFEGRYGARPGVRGRRDPGSRRMLQVECESEGDS